MGQPPSGRRPQAATKRALRPASVKYAMLTDTQQSASICEIRGSPAQLSTCSTICRLRRPPPLAQRLCISPAYNLSAETQAQNVLKSPQFLSISVQKCQKMLTSLRVLPHFCEFFPCLSYPDPASSRPSPVPSPRTHPALRAQPKIPQNPKFHNPRLYSVIPPNPQTAAILPKPAFFQKRLSRLCFLSILI
jgi:hypothetical protein